MESKRIRLTAILFIAVEMLKTAALLSGVLIFKLQDSRQAVIASTVISPVIAICVFSGRYAHMKESGSRDILELSLTGIAVDCVACIAVYLAVAICLLSRQDDLLALAVIFSGIFIAGAHLAIYMTTIVIFFAGYGVILLLTQEQKQDPPLSHEQEERRTGNEKKQNGIF